MEEKKSMISVNKALYSKLSTYCDRKKLKRKQVIEDLINEFISKSEIKEIIEM